MFIFILIGFLTVVTVSVLQFLYKHHNVNKRLKGFVSPPGLPLLKHFFLLSSELGFLENLLNITKKYGGLVKLELCSGIPFLVVTDPNFVSYILSSQKYLDKDIFYELTEPWVGTGLVTCSSEKWRKTRKIINPAFNVQVLEAHLKSFENPSKILIQKLKKEAGKGSFDVLPHISLCTMDILSETIMGVKLNTQENPGIQYVSDIKEETAIIVRRLLSPIKRHPTLYMLTRDYWKEKKVLERIHNFTSDIINTRNKIRTETISNGNGVRHTSDKSTSHGKTQTSLVDILSDATYNDRSMTEKEIMDEVQSFLFAGHDTTATCVSLVLYCLSKHRDFQCNVVEELNQIFGNDSRPPNAKDLNDMVYLDMVIKETMRYYSPVPLISRKIEEDLSYDNVFIPKGMSIMIYIYGMHRNPNYFVNPDTFDPSRFESECKPFTYLPFSAGPRSCIGQRFAQMEIKYLVCEILRNFRIPQEIGHVPQQIAQIVLKFKNGIKIKLESR